MTSEPPHRKHNGRVCNDTVEVSKWVLFADDDDWIRWTQAHTSQSSTTVLCDSGTYWRVRRSWSECADILEASEDHSADCPRCCRTSVFHFSTIYGISWYTELWTSRHLSHILFNYCKVHLKCPWCIKCQGDVCFLIIIHNNNYYYYYRLTFIVPYKENAKKSRNNNTMPMSNRNCIFLT